MTRLRRSRTWAKGTWRRWVYGPSRTVGSTVSCGNCGKAMSVGGGRKFGSEHTIAADGTVMPSVVCPYDCGWHVFVQLVGWKP